jgi:hypothetical protein
LEAQPSCPEAQGNLRLNPVAIVRLQIKVSTSVQSTESRGGFETPKGSVGIAKRRQRGVCHA